MTSGVYTRKPEHLEKIKEQLSRARNPLMVSQKLKGRKMSEDIKRKISIANKGKKNSLGKKHSIEARKAKSERSKGEKSHLWQGGLTPINNSIRHSLEYRLWRESVFTRDNWTCVWCKKRGGELNADHIKPFAYYPELRFAIDNGRTLCVPCHKTTDNYAGKGLKRNSYVKK